MLMFATLHVDFIFDNSSSCLGKMILCLCVVEGQSFDKTKKETIIQIRNVKVPTHTEKSSIMRIKSYSIGFNVWNLCLLARLMSAC